VNQRILHVTHDGVDQQRQYAVATAEQDEPLIPTAWTQRGAVTRWSNVVGHLSARHTRGCCCPSCMPGGRTGIHRG